MASTEAPPRVVHVTLSNQSGVGGPALSVTSVCEVLGRLGCDVRLCSVDWGPAFGEPVSIDRSLVKVYTVRGFVWPKPRLWLAPTFARMLRHVAADADLIHLHGFWSGLTNATCKLARRVGMPYIISIHGQLSAPSLRRSAWKKAIVRRLFADRNFRDAACLHATAVHELGEIRAFGLHNSVAVVAHGLETAPYAAIDPAAAKGRVAARFPATAGKRLLFFLARVVPHKNPLLLIQVWSRLHERFGDWHLVITGPDEMGHVKELQAAASQLGCSSKVTFTGPTCGEEKMDLLGACDVLVLPSLSENFGMSVAEALAAGKPVITTVTTPWEGVRQRRCGWCIDLGAAPLEAALAEALAADERTLTEMGLRGRRLVEENYSLDRVARQYLDLYAWIMGRAERPAFVYLDEEGTRER